MPYCSHEENLQILILFNPHNNSVICPMTIIDRDERLRQKAKQLMQITQPVSGRTEI